MNQLISIVLSLLLLTYSSASSAENCGDDDCGGLGGPAIPVFVEPPPVMKDSDKETFNLKELVGTSMNGMLSDECGGYCLVGVCADLFIGFSLTKGFYYYTIISPRIKHALPELLVSAYDGVGREPLKEWRDTIGKALSKSNSSIVTKLLGSPDGLQQGQNGGLIKQYTTYKEIDIVGHPMAMLPDLINEGSKPNLSGYKVPDYGKISKVNANNPAPQDQQTKKDLNDSGFGFDTNKIKIPTLDDLIGTIKKKLKAAIMSFKIAQQIENVLQTAQTIKNMKESIETITKSIEATSMAMIKSSGWGNLAKPKYKMPRLFCPTNIKTFQPYYLSFADSFWWRSGYPLTDGPISGSDKSKIIVNLLSKDTLPSVKNTKELLSKEIWGHLYPRDGAIGQPHDAKAASVLAWRGMDVLKTAVKKGDRVGVPLPKPKKDVTVTGGKWQLIYPQVKQCKDEPFYGNKPIKELKDLKDLKYDSLKENTHGGYAWNYYRNYECCSGKKSSIQHISVPLPKLCLKLDDIMAGIEEDRIEYEEWQKQQQQIEDSQAGN